MEIRFEEFEHGVFRLTQGRPDKRIAHDGEVLFSFMDRFYTRKEHLDELTPEEVGSLCHARSRHPELISETNEKVQSIFRKLVGKLCPSKLLEIGSGSRPIFREAPENCLCVLSDADPSIKESITGSLDFCEFSGVKPKLDYGEDFFDMVVAVFVLQFHFHDEQISELYRCMASDGIFIANVYRRTEDACGRLQKQFESKGFYVLRVPDTQSLCRAHEYWIISKCQKRLAVVEARLIECLN